MNVFYAPDISNEKYTLNEEESRHCVKVLRLAEGDSLLLIDGKGGRYKCEVSLAHHKHCEVKILSSEKEVGKRSYHIEIAIAPTKNMSRFDTFVEKSCELGIDKIIPIICSRSERKVVKPERLIKLALSATKQSQQTYLPEIAPATPFKQFIKETFLGNSLVAHCVDSKKSNIGSIYEKNKNVRILIGPEGDFTEEEIELATKSGFLPISLGNTRLRTETAGIAACHAIHLIND